MTIEYSCETDIDLGLDCEADALLVAEQVLNQEECPYEAQISLILTDDASIREVNQEFRGIDQATDVLSFPMVPFASPADYQILEEDLSFFEPDSGELACGSVGRGRMVPPDAVVAAIATALEGVVSGGSAP